jgi:hypothetical protein
MDCVVRRFDEFRLGLIAREAATEFGTTQASFDL